MESGCGRVWTNWDTGYRVFEEYIYAMRFAGGTI